MKNLLLFTFCCFTFCAFSQVNNAMPPEANLFYNNAMRSIKPEIQNLVKSDAKKLENKNINTDSLTQALTKNPLLKKYNYREIEGISVLILVQACKNADENLKNLVLKLRNAQERNSASFNETQAILEHKSKIAESITTIIKKIIPSQESVINNLK